MRKYQSHKVVEAGQITDFSFDGNKEGWSIEVDGNEWVKVTTEEYNRIVGASNYTKGGYLVRYSDGYISWSPAQPFEEGYTLLDT